VSDKKIKLAIISHALVIPPFRNRWEKLAQDPNYEVHLFVPKHWEQNWFGEKKIYRTEDEAVGNYFVHAMATTDEKNWGRYLLKSFAKELKILQPNLIYIIHEEGILVHHQIYLYKRLFSPKSKVIFFSMNARGVPWSQSRNWLKKMIGRMMWWQVKKCTDAVLAHYPGCQASLRAGGYQKPIYLQTQVGVDEKLFSPNAEIRHCYRKKVGADGCFVIGYCGRMTEDKGVDDLLSVFIGIAESNPSFFLLLVGSGPMKEEIETTLLDKGLSHRCLVTGFIEQSEIPHYMNAMDLFVLGSKTMPHWIDTFPLVTVQAQSVGVPVLASDSASLPWQLGDSAKFFPEGNRKALKGELLNLIEDDKLRKELSLRGMKRSHEYFCHEGMTDNFKNIASQVISNKVQYHKQGETYAQWKAYD
jgi:glycosyltransferase involved in cell wall biosynthesis